MTATSSSCRQLPGALFTLHEGDARRLDDLLRPYSDERHPLLTTTITSPPYGDLKNYRHPDQIGWGQPYDEYLAEMRRVFRTIHRHTRDDGSMWIIADTLRPREERDARWRLEPLPFQLADEATDAGWILRDVIIWRKNKARPWSSPGRLRNGFEYILFFVKTSDFKYHVDRLRETTRLEQYWVKWPERYNPQGKVPDNVWEFPIPVQGTWGSTAVQHACPLPADLVERPIVLSTDPGDVVLDPFAGSGVVLAEAERLDRRPIGIELVKKHVTAYRRLVRPEILQRRGRDVIAEHQRHNEWLRKTIVKLRVLKYARLVTEALMKARPDLPRPLLVIALGRVRQEPDDGQKLATAEISVVMEAPAEMRGQAAEALKIASQRKPTSMFGVDGTFRVVEPTALPVFKRKTLDAYLSGRMYATAGRVRTMDLISFARGHEGSRHPPVVSNIKVDETPRPIEGVGETNGKPNGSVNGKGSVDAGINAVRVAVRDGIPVNEPRTKPARSRNRAGLREPHGT